MIYSGGPALTIWAVESTYLQRLRRIVTTQATTIVIVSPLISLQDMHVNECCSLLYHIQPTSILITQLGAKSEAFLLRERVLRNAVTE